MTLGPPRFITPPGSLGTVPEGIFWQTTVFAESDSATFTADITAGSPVLRNVNIADWSNVWIVYLITGRGMPQDVPEQAPAQDQDNHVVSFSEAQRTITIAKPATETITGGTFEIKQGLYYIMISGSLPEGVQCRLTGLIEGVPKAVGSLQGVPAEVSRNVTSRFTVRVFTERYLSYGGEEVIDKVVDRTFNLTVTGQDAPEWRTPSGNLGTFYDGEEVDIRVEYRDQDPDDRAIVRRIRGQLPPGLTLSRDGVISGIITPLVGPPGTAQAGWDLTPRDLYPWDFRTRSTSQNYQFTLEVTDGKDADIRTFEIYVYSKSSMSADTVNFTADNTFITADVTPTRTPILLTPPGSIGQIRADNYFTFKFDAVDLDGDAIEYVTITGAGVGYDESLFDQDLIGFDRAALALPPGLTLTASTGYLTGYIPDQGATENTYQWLLAVRKATAPSITTPFYNFTATLIGDIDTEVSWITPENLGAIDNGSISTFSVQAVNVGGRSMSYRLLPASNSKLPQGLELLPSGNIAGRVSFNTFALDGGTTTFDKLVTTRLVADETTFDLEYDFTVNAFAPATEQLGFQVERIEILDPGTGYTGQPTITISAPPAVDGAVRAAAGLATITGTAITEIAVGNPGRGYSEPPTVTISGGGGEGATARAVMRQIELVNAVSVLRRFTITVTRRFDEPYQSLYVKCMPPERDRDVISSLLQNRDLIPIESIYRADDPNFGVSQNVSYVQAFGLQTSDLDDYLRSLDQNHYWKNVVLGEIKTARALDQQGSVLYEVVYSEIQDNLVNNQGVSVGKQVTLPYAVRDGTITEVYPNSLQNMSDQVVASVGRVTQDLPLWMSSKQENGTILNYVPAWVIAYVRPGESGKVAYRLRLAYRDILNQIDFKIDRYELDRSQTYLWNIARQKWIPYPAEATVFDQDRTVFDGDSVTFIAPADRWTGTDEFDKYVMFPKRTILG